MQIRIRKRLAFIDKYVKFPHNGIKKIVSHFDFLLLFKGNTENPVYLQEHVKNSDHIVTANSK
jgi:hypothetical protein